MFTRRTALVWNAALPRMKYPPLKSSSGSLKRGTKSQLITRSVHDSTDEVLISIEKMGHTVVNRNLYERERHGKGESHHESLFTPRAVLYPESTQAVSDILKLCRVAKIPIVPFGAGTSIEGHVCCVEEGSVSIDLTKLNEIKLPTDGFLDDFHVRVGAGVHRLHLNEELRHTGMQFMVDPGADATIGGMVACGASGTAAVRYGTMRENILALEVVLSDGSIVKCGTHARKSSAGYDLVSLMCGSEGTLGIITEITVKLHPIMPCVTSAMCVFSSLHAAAEAVNALLQSGVVVDRCELLDTNSIVAFNRYSKELDDLPEMPHMFLEFSGSHESSVNEQVNIASKICLEDFGCSSFIATSDASERRRLWSARHQLYYASLALRPGSSGIVTDVCVPLSKLADIIQSTADDVEELQVIGPCFGHCGDGNFHCILPVLDSDDDDYRNRVEEVNRRLIKRAIAVEGTVTGEHGVGTGKIKYLPEMYGQEAIDMMMSVKTALDPDNIMNPGKVFNL